MLLLLQQIAERWGSSWFSGGLGQSGCLSKWRNGLMETLWNPVKVSIKCGSWDGIAPCNNIGWYCLPREQLCRKRARTPGLHDRKRQFCTTVVMKANSTLLCIDKSVASRLKKVIFFTFLSTWLLRATSRVFFPGQGFLVDESLGTELILVERVTIKWSEGLWFPHYGVAQFVEHNVIWGWFDCCLQLSNRVCEEGRVKFFSGTLIEKMSSNDHKMQQVLMG